MATCSDFSFQKKEKHTKHGRDKCSSSNVGLQSSSFSPNTVAWFCNYQGGTRQSFLRFRQFMKMVYLSLLVMSESIWIRLGLGQRSRIILMFMKRKEKGWSKGEFSIHHDNQTSSLFSIFLMCYIYADKESSWKKSVSHSERVRLCEEVCMRSV